MLVMLMLKWMTKTLMLMLVLMLTGSSRCNKASPGSKPSWSRLAPVCRAANILELGYVLVMAQLGLVYKEYKHEN